MAQNTRENREGATRVKTKLGNADNFFFFGGPPRLFARCSGYGAP